MMMRMEEEQVRVERTVVFRGHPLGFPETVGGNATAPPQGGKLVSDKATSYQVMQ